MRTAVGVVRRTDYVGRICLPKELLRKLGIDEGQPLEIYVGDEGIIALKKYAPECIFCGEVKGVTQHKGKNICPQCFEALKTEISS